MEQVENQKKEKQVVLLDLSMFLLDLLSPQKIRENSSSSNIILEVPGALVTMMWSAMADTELESDMGKGILFDFIHAHLLGVKNNPIHQNSNDHRILDVVFANPEKLHLLASITYQRLFSEFAPLIEGATKRDYSNSESKNGNNRQYLIRRYEPSVSLGAAEEYYLQKAYKDNFGLQAHPLYDLYFLQIFHAQTIGLAASPVLTRQLIALGRQTYYSLKEWKKPSGINWDEKEYTANERVQVEEFLTAFSEWEPFILGVLVDITVSSIVPGGNFVLTAIASGLISKELEGKNKEAIKPIMRAAIIGFIVFLIVWWGCPPIIALLKFLGTSKEPFPTPTLYLGTTPAPTPTIFSSPTSSILTYTPAIPATFHSTMDPISIADLVSNSGYCLYVVQPGDTLQSIASWFMISENDIRNSDKAVSSGVFIVNQLIKINVPCCTHIGVENGFSYRVVHGDNVFRLAKNNTITPKEIVLANNLYDVRYIQAGQMLCIPYP